MLNYGPLWETMAKKNISQYYLIKNGIDNKVIYKLKRNDNITALTMEKLCRIIGCEPSDIIKFTE